MVKVDQVSKSPKSEKSASIHHGLLITFMKGNKAHFYHSFYLVQVFYQLERQTLKKKFDKEIFDGHFLKSCAQITFLRINKKGLIRLSPYFNSNINAPRPKVCASVNPTTRTTRTAICHPTVIADQDQYCLGPAGSQPTKNWVLVSTKVTDPGTVFGERARGPFAVHVGILNKREFHQFMFSPAISLSFEIESRFIHIF